MASAGALTTCLAGIGVNTTTDLGSDITVHWGEICGNDWLRTTADVRLPSSLALFLLGSAGLAAGTLCRRV